MKKILVREDGAAYWAAWEDFKNLQESPCCFGESREAAVYGLLEREDMLVPAIVSCDICHDKGYIISQTENKLTTPDGHSEKVTEVQRCDDCMKLKNDDEAQIAYLSDLAHDMAALPGDILILYPSRKMSTGGELVRCHLCGSAVPADQAHLHQDEWIGPCCWDDRLKGSE